MKNSIIISLVSLLSGLTATAQSDLTWTLNKDGKIFIIPKKIDYEFHIPKQSYKSYTPSSTHKIEYKLKEFHSDPITLHMDERPMDMQVLSAAYQPYFNVFSPMLRKMSPMAFDFNESLLVSINEKFSFITNGQKYTWPGAGGLTTLDGHIIWKEGPWTLSGGVYGGHYYTPFNPSPALMGGVQASVHFQATDWLGLKAWGRYAEYGDKNKRNGHVMMNPFFYHTEAGSALEIKFNDNFGIGMGLDFQYNPIKRKIEPKYMLYPIFY